MMPRWVPWPEILQKMAGAAEVAGGIGVLMPHVRRAAGWGWWTCLSPGSQCGQAWNLRRAHRVWTFSTGLFSWTCKSGNSGAYLFL
jgi:hypothetical protein